MNNQDFKISIEKPKREFEHFLNAPNNRRIIFSGAFGSGKTWFLKEFFSDTEKYYYIRLTPVNYAASQNEDIFELVKFDILFHILRENALPEDLNFSKTEILQFPELLDPEKGLSGIIGKISRSGHSFYDLPDDVIQKASHENQEAPSDRFKQYKEFRQKITQTKGSPYEHDDITNLIFTIITALKQSPKETILLIDDMDRIDPEHIFRILNVLAAHFDIDETENKFGFDKIILVCDIQNIRRIFRNRYGQDTDFSGYIDKFYSRRVFEFDNKQVLQEALLDILGSIKISPANMAYLNSHSQYTYTYNFIWFILHRLVMSKTINLRALDKIRGQSINLSIKKLKYDKKTYTLLLYIIDLLVNFVGDFNALVEALEICNSIKIGSNIIDQDDPENKIKLGIILPALIHDDNIQVGVERYYSLSESGIIIGFNMPNIDPSNPIKIANITEIKQKPNEKIPLDIFPYLLEAIRIMQRSGALAG